MQYRKKPVVIEAVQFTGINFEEIEVFVGGDAEVRDGELVIATLEGPLRAAPSDWIIKGINGEFYPCKPDIFAKTYEPVCESCEHWSTDGQDCTLVAPETGCIHIP